MSHHPLSHGVIIIVTNPVAALAQRKTEASRARRACRRGVMRCCRPAVPKTTAAPPSPTHRHRIHSPHASAARQARRQIPPDPPPRSRQPSSAAFSSSPLSHAASSFRLHSSAAAISPARRHGPVPHAFAPPLSPTSCQALSSKRASTGYKSEWDGSEWIGFEGSLVITNNNYIYFLKK